MKLYILKKDEKDNAEGSIKMDNLEKLETQGTQDEDKQNKTQHNMLDITIRKQRNKT